MRLNRIITGAILSSFMLAAEPQQQFETAVAAYQQGDYHKAAQIWQASIFSLKAPKFIVSSLVNE